MVAVTLAGGAALLLLAVRHSVLGSLDDSARQQAKDVAALASSNRLPDPVPIGAGTAGVQIVDATGRVTAVSAGTDRLTALLEPADVTAVRAGQVRVIGGARLGTPDPLRVVGYPVVRDGQPETVLVAVSQAEANGTVRALGVSTAVGAPLLLAAFALVCWLLVGRSLQPVSRLRAGAEEIAAAGSADGRRLPVPPAQDEIRRLALTLNGMLDRLEQASDTQRAFVADAAHELRSPLTAIRTQLEVARHHPAGVDWDQTASGVLADTARLTRLVDDLLLLARVAGGTPPGPPRSPPAAVDVVALAQDVAAGRSWRVPVRIEADGSAAGPVLLAADADAVTRVLVNLVDNAARHASSAVHVAVGREPGQVRLTVTDDGPGIDPADRLRAFERFARLDEARARRTRGEPAQADGPGPDAGGYGLGLAIVRGLVASAGGQVAFVDPPVPPGACAVVTWPLRGQ